MKQNPNLCEFDIGLYESVLQLALPEKDRVDLPKFEKNGRMIRELAKVQPATKIRSDEDLIKGIRQERLAAEQLREQMEEADVFFKKAKRSKRIFVKDKVQNGTDM